MMKIFRETPRLILAEYSIDLFDEISNIYTDPSVVKYTLQNNKRTREEILTIVKNEIKIYEEFKSTRGKWLLLDRSTKEIVGYVGLLYLNKLDTYEISYSITRQYCGNGYATEAAADIIHYALKDLNYSEVIALVEKENSKSIAVVNKLGFKYDTDVELYGYTFNLFRITN